MSIASYHPKHIDEEPLVKQCRICLVCGTCTARLAHPHRLCGDLSFSGPTAMEVEDPANQC